MARRDYVVIADEAYAIQKLPPGKNAWEESTVYEPPFEGGMPEELYKDWDSWHMGSGDTEDVLYGRTERGRNTDTLNAGYILPGPEVTNITLTSSADPPTKFFEALGVLFVIAGRRLYRINLSTFAVTLSLDLSAAGDNIIDGLEWEGRAVITTDASAAGDIRELSSLGAGPDSWGAAHATQNGYYLAKGPKELFTIDGTSQVSKIAAGNFASSANWSAEVQIGEDTIMPTGLVAWREQVFVGKPNGFFGFDRLGEPVSIVGELENGSSLANARNPHVWNNSILVPWQRGLMRYYMPGYEAAGVERQPVNRSEIWGQWFDFAPDGNRLFAAQTIGSHGYIRVGREKAPGEQGFGPIIWDDWVFLPNEPTRAVYLTSANSTFGGVLFFGRLLDAARVVLVGEFGAPDVWSSGYSFSTTAGLNDRHMPYSSLGVRGLDIHWTKLQVQTEDCDSGRYWEAAYNIDREEVGATHTLIEHPFLDEDGQDAVMNTNGMHTLYFPPETTGRKCQVSVSWTNNDDEVPPKITFMRLFGIPLPEARVDVRVQVELGLGVISKSMRLRKTPQEQLATLHTLINEDCQTVEDMWGNTRHMKVRAVRAIETQAENGAGPRLLAEVLMHEVDAV